MWIYDIIMFVQFCTVLPICIGAFDVVLYFVNPTVLVANKLTSYLILLPLARILEITTVSICQRKCRHFCFLAYQLRPTSMYRII